MPIISQKNGCHIVKTQTEVSTAATSAVYDSHTQSTEMMDTEPVFHKLCFHM